MSLFFNNGAQRPSAILGNPAGHPQARNLVHWIPGLSGDPFSGGDAFVGRYAGVTDVVGNVSVKDANDIKKVVAPEIGGIAFWAADTAYHQTAIVWTPKVSAFRGVAAGGLGGTVNVWLKLKLHTPVDWGRGGLGILSLSGLPVSLYPDPNGQFWMNVLRGDRIGPFSISAPEVDRTQWHMLTITHTGYVWKMYQNAKLVYTDLTGDGHVYLGSGNNYVTIHGDWVDGAHVLNGYSCDWRIYNRALSDAEIQTLYHPSTRWSLYYGG